MERSGPRRNLRVLDLRSRHRVAPRTLALAAAGRGAGLLAGAVEGEQAEVKGLAIRQPSPEQERPDRGCDRAIGIPGARDRARTGDPHVGKEMLWLISLRFFAQSGHIDAFRSIVGDGRGGEKLLGAAVLPGETEHQSR